MAGSKEGESGVAAHSTPLRRKGGTVLFVGNLPFGTPWQRIKDCFRAAGGVRYTDLIADRDGRPKGSAIVTMVSAEDAERAIAKLNESEFDGRRLIVRYFHDDHSRRPRLVQRDLMPGYNNNSTPNTSSGSLSKRALHRGGKNAGGLPKSTGCQAPGGSNMEAGARGYSEKELMHPTTSESCIVADEWVKNPHVYTANECWIYVNNLPLDCTVKTLELTFTQVSEPLVSQLLGTLNAKNIGRLLMKSKEEAQYAITEFDGVMMAHCEMKVGVETDAVRATYKQVIHPNHKEDI